MTKINRHALYRPFTQKFFTLTASMKPLYQMPSFYPMKDENKTLHICGTNQFQKTLSQNLPMFRYCWKKHNAFRFILTTKMAQTAARTSPIGHWHSSKPNTRPPKPPNPQSKIPNPQSKSGTSSITSMPCSTIPPIGRPMRPTCGAICRTSPLWRPNISGRLWKSADVWPKSTSTTNNNPNTSWPKWKTPTNRSITASKRCASRQQRFLSLGGIPPQVFDYKLGNRSALVWVMISTTESGVDRNDPNNLGG